MTSIVLKSAWVLVFGVGGSLALRGQSCPQWRAGFDAPGFGGVPSAHFVYDDGNGPAWYMAGAFDVPGTNTRIGLMRWSGSAWEYQAWSALSGGVIHDAEVFDDGSGPALFVTGTFVNIGGVSAARIAKRQGGAWSPLSSGLAYTLSLPEGRALAAFDDGSGPALYVAGAFTTAGGVSAKSIARWRASGWSAVGAGMGGTCKDLEVFDDGSGPELYVAGSFDFWGAGSCGDFGKWNGASWDCLNSGFSADVRALEVHDDGSGAALYAGGYFFSIGGSFANSIARWDGAQFSPVGSGLSGVAFVEALESFPGPQGQQLIASGLFTNAGGVAVKNIASWSNGAWHSFEPSGAYNDSGTIAVLGEMDLGAGPELHVGGNFNAVGGAVGDRLVRTDGAQWSGYGGLGCDAAVSCARVLDDGSGPALYVGGGFDIVGGIATNYAARFDGQAWSSLGDAPSEGVHGLEVFDDGAGPRLYAGGISYGSPGALLRHDGTNWQWMAQLNGAVSALQSFDDGTGPALYVGGDFNVSPGLSQRYLGKWNGSGWTTFAHPLDDAARAFAVFDDGTGPALYMGGAFTTVAGATARGLARWNGAQWLEVGGGLDGEVTTLAVADIGGGAELYVGGSFMNAGGQPASHVVAWNGSTWTYLGGGTTDTVNALAGFDDGSGAQLYAGGYFFTGAFTVAGRVRRWNGTSWSLVADCNTYGSVTALAAFETPSGRSLFAGGSFATIAGVASVGIAELVGCWEPGAVYCVGDGSCTACPCGNASTVGSGQGCVNSTGGGAALGASGSRSVSLDDQVLTATGLPPQKSCILFAGTMQTNSGLGLPFDAGLRCAGGAIRRFPLSTSSAGGVAAWGAGLSAHGGWIAGDTRYFQVWYRDPSGPCPAGSNLSSGYEIAFTQ